MASGIWVTVGVSDMDNKNNRHSILPSIILLKSLWLPLDAQARTYYISAVDYVDTQKTKQKLSLRSSPNFCCLSLTYFELTPIPLSV